MSEAMKKQTSAPRGLSGNMDEVFLGNVLDMTVVRRLLRYAFAYRRSLLPVSLLACPGSFGAVCGSRLATARPQ